MSDNPIKIAILVRAETTHKCVGKGCLKSFFAKSESFARYRGKEIQLVGFLNTGGDLPYKLKRLKEDGVQVIHVSTCIRGKDPNYEELVRNIAKEFDVIGYTHGSPDGENVGTVSITGKYIQ